MNEGAGTAQHGLWRDALLVFLLPLAIYAATASRTIMPEDDGLFVLASYFLGIAHPPGYPLFVLLSHPFSWLPLESIAFRIHLASSVFASFAVLAAWWTMLALPGVSRLGALTGALALAVSVTFWSQAIIAEVYCLNAAMFLLLLGLSVRYLKDVQAGRDPSLGRLCLIAFLVGLSLTNHWPLMLMAGMGLAVMFIPAWRRLLRAAPLLALMVCLGLLPYAWLYFRSRMGIPISFYGPLDPESFWFMVSRQGYAAVDHSESAGLSDKLGFIGFCFSELVNQFKMPGLALGIIGFTLQWRHWPRTLTIGLTVSFLASTVLLASLLGFDYSEYYRNLFRVYPILAYAIWAVWIALGLSALVRRLNELLRSLAWRPHFVQAGCGLLIIYLGASHAASNDYHLDDLAERFARTTLNSLPENALVLIHGDMYFGPLVYTHMLDGVRPDLTLFNPNGLVLGNRLFDPIIGSEERHAEIVTQFVGAASQPVCATGEGWTYGFAFEEAWLFQCLRAGARAGDNTFRLYPEHIALLRQLLNQDVQGKPWLTALRDSLLHRMGQLATYMIYGREGVPANPALLETYRDLMGSDYGRLGALDMLLSNVDPSLKHHSVLVRSILSTGANDAFEVKEDAARFRYLSGLAHDALGEHDQALADYVRATMTWPDPRNAAAVKLLPLAESGVEPLEAGLAEWLRAKSGRITEIDRDRRDRANTLQGLDR